MRKKKISLLVFVLIVSFLLILTNFFTIKVLSAVRAYINGESEYSKGQKDASLYLATFVQTENPAYWVLFDKSIEVPIGDNMARTSLEKNEDEELISKGFFMGHNHPDDFKDMIWLFKTFHSISFMKKAIDIWASAEPLINQLKTIGEDIDLQVRQHKLTALAKMKSIEEVSLISSQLSEKERAFSQALGNAARDIKNYLLITNIFLILLLLGLVGLYATYMIHSLSVTELALQFKMNELKETNSELERFTYVASHDLQEPLRMVSGFLLLLQKKYEGKLDEKAQTYIHYAVDGADRMKILINDLLEYSKINVSNRVFADVDLYKIAKQLKIVFQASFTEPGSQLSISNLPLVKANEVQMQQLFQNLVSNAVKYRSELAPQVIINAGESATHWLFSVKDNGKGIDPRDHEKVFVIFKRLHNNDTHKGTGIGLATCKKIVEGHGGTIWIESALGKGSTFHFTLAKLL